MNILADIHGYPPWHNAGAEYMAHHLLRELLNYGHKIIVICGPDNYEIEGIEVKADTEANIEEYYTWSDIVVTHLDKTGRVYNYCEQYSKPMFHIIHNHYINAPAQQQFKVKQFAIYNSNWVQQDRKDIHEAIKDSIVVHPPIFFKDYQTEHINNYITLINLYGIKGGDIFHEIARKMPDRKFMGVMGNYGSQEIHPEIKNIHYTKNTPEIVSKVYRRTRILLMPSVYETFGRTAIEACCSGIPVICSRTALPCQGLTEALSDAGIFINDRKNINEWIIAIKSLDDENEYQEVSRKCIARAKYWDEKSREEIFDLNEWLKKKL